MHNLLIIHLLFILPLNTFADYTEACFEDSKIAAHAKKEIQFLTTKQDKIVPVGGCLKIETSTSRLNLFQKFLRQKYVVSFNDFSTSIPPATCEVILRKVSTEIQDGINASAKNVNARSKGIKTTTTSKLVLTEGLKSEIGYNNNKYFLICYKKRDGFNIQVTSTSPDMQLNVNRYLDSNQEIELGEIIKNSESNDKNLSTDQLLQVSKNKASSNDKLYIKIK